MMKKVIVILSSFALFAACSQETEEVNYGRCPQANSEDIVSTVTDIDGNTYKTIKIGNKEWITSSLKTTKFNDGTPIKNITNNKEWSETKDAAYATYNNEENGEVLYNWAAASSDKLCPEGWTVPQDTVEWLQLAATYAKVENATGWDKVPTTTGWEASSFQATPAGFRERDGAFYEKDNIGLWWTKNHHNEQNAMYIYMKSEISSDSTKTFTGINKSHIGRTTGLSVRCVRQYTKAEQEIVDTIASAITDSLMLSAKK